MYGNSAAATTDTATGGTLVSGGHTDLNVATFRADPAYPSVTFNLSALSRSATGTLNVIYPPSNNVSATTTTPMTNSISQQLGDAERRLVGGENRLENHPLLNYISGDLYSSGTNTEVITGTGIPSGFATNTLRINGSVTATFSGTNTIQSGGIPARTGTNTSTITGGTITSGTGELVVHCYSLLTIDSALSLPNGLTKTGSSPLILTGDYSGLTGPVTVNNGYLRFGRPGWNSGGGGANRMTCRHDPPPAHPGRLRLVGL